MFARATAPIASAAITKASNTSMAIHMTAIMPSMAMKPITDLSAKVMILSERCEGTLPLPSAIADKTITEPKCGIMPA